MLGPAATGESLNWGNGFGGTSMKRVPPALTAPEQRLVDQAHPGELGQLDEYDAVELEGRLRRLRDKYTTRYRRTARADIAENRSRRQDRAGDTRDLEKAEMFSHALTVVSRRVAAICRDSERQLREERIAAARAATGTRPATVPRQRHPSGPPRAIAEADRQPESAAVLRAPVTKKRWASTAALGARNQARRDSR